MAFLDWSDKLSVGVKSIDQQHQALVEILNQLHTAMLKGQAQTVTGPLLKKLVDYTVYHFSTEESLMAKTSYPGSASHRAKHTELTGQVSDFVGRYERGEIRLSLELLNFLHGWLGTHIQKEDMAYGPWLTQHGVK